MFITLTARLTKSAGRIIKLSSSERLSVGVDVAHVICPVAVLVAKPEDRIKIEKAQN